jgi:hypothetical protein
MPCARGGKSVGVVIVVSKIADVMKFNPKVSRARACGDNERRTEKMLQVMTTIIDLTRLPI